MATKPIELDETFLSEESSDDEGVGVPLNLYNQIELVTNIDDFFSLREQWNQLNEDAVNGNIFVSWEWLYTWWETYKDQSNRSLYILKCTDSDNELLGLAPFQIINNPKKYFPCSRQLVFLGTGETDGSLTFGEYMDLILKKGHETAVINSFSNYLEENSNLWDGAKFNQQLLGSHLRSLFQLQSEANSESTDKHLIGNKNIAFNVSDNGFRTFIDLPETYKDYLMGLQKKMRNNITRTFSRLESEQDYSIEIVTTDSEVKAQIEGKPSAIDIIADLNRARRGELEKDSVFAQPKFVLFHERLLKRLLPLNKVSLKILKFDDEPVAALYSFIDGDTVHAYQSGFDTEQGYRYSLLTTMLTQEIASSIQNPDISCFNFMYSNKEDTYKKRYSGTTEKMYDFSYDNVGMKYSAYAFLHGPVKSLVKKLIK